MLYMFMGCGQLCVISHFCIALFPIYRQLNNYCIKYSSSFVVDSHKRQQSKINQMLSGLDKKTINLLNGCMITTSVSISIHVCWLCHSGGHTMFAFIQYLPYYRRIWLLSACTYNARSQLTMCLT